MKKKLFKIVVAFLLSATVFVGCDDKKEIKKPAEFSITPKVSNFGEIEEGKTVEQMFTISNKGGSSLEIKSVSITGNNASDFTTKRIKTTVVAGKTYQLKVSFVPQKLGNKKATLIIVSNIGTHTVALSGLAVSKPMPQFVITPKSKDFGNVEEKTTTSQEFVITNGGTSNLEITAFAFEDAKSSDFVTNAKATIVAAGKTYSFSVSFNPKTEGAKTAVLKITANVGEYRVALSGKALPKPKAKFSIDLSDFDFGEVDLNTTVEKGFIISNMGNADLQISDFMVTTETEGEFTIDVPQTPPISVPAGGNYSSKLFFTPKIEGERTVTYTFVTNVGEYIIKAKGKGINTAKPEFAIDKKSCAFGVIPNKMKFKKEFIITNNGTSDLVVSAFNFGGPNATEFTTNVAGDFNVAPGKSKTFQVVVAGISRGDKSAKMTILTNDGNHVVDLSAKTVDIYFTAFAFSSSGEQALLWKNGEVINLGTTGFGAASPTNVVVENNKAYAAYALDGTPRSLAIKTVEGYTVTNTKKLPYTPNEYTSVRRIYVRNGNTYVVGDKSIYDKDGKLVEIAVLWKNGVIEQIGDGITSSRASAVYIDPDDNVYIAGIIADSKTGKNRAVYWKNGTIHTLGSNTDESRPFSIYGNNGKLFIGGTANKKGVIWNQDGVPSYYPNGNIAIAFNDNGVNCVASGLTIWRNGVKNENAFTTEGDAFLGDISDVFIVGDNAYAVGSGFSKVTNGTGPVLAINKRIIPLRDKDGNGIVSPVSIFVVE